MNDHISDKESRSSGVVLLFVCNSARQPKPKMYKGKVIGL